MAPSVVRDRKVRRTGEDREIVLRVRPGNDEERDNPSVHEQIALLAYSYWLARGCPFGSPEEDWLQSEREIQEQQRLATGVA